MAEYKRMVSYMYQYENGVKKKNVGFARVEAKSGQCKITLHMQLLGQLDSIFPTYLIRRDETKLELIYLGDTVLKSQVMDSKLFANETNIMDSGYELADMGGLLLFFNDKVFFATEWDDKPIFMKDVLEAMKPKPKKLQLPKEKEDMEKEDTGNEVSVAKGNLELKGTVPTTEGYVKEEEKAAGSIEDFEPEVAVTEKENYMNPEPSILEQMMMPKYKLPRGWKTVERLQNPYTYTASDFSQNVVEAAYMPTSDLADIDEVAQENNQFNESQNLEEYSFEDIGIMASYTELIINENQSVNEDRGINKNQDINENKNINENEYINEEQGTKEDQDINEKQDMNETEIGKLNMENEQEETEIPDSPTAIHLFEKYPRIYPFEDNEITLCVKIEPKDIGLLPKEIWTLSNNSFLMHGFYCYHHLIFAKMKDRFGCRYILGVPGIYHNRERFMARMFGFDGFKSIRKRELRQGDFGYWYLPISL